MHALPTTLASFSEDGVQIATTIETVTAKLPATTESASATVAGSDWAAGETKGRRGEAVPRLPRTVPVTTRTGAMHALPTTHAPFSEDAVQINPTPWLPEIPAETEAASAPVVGGDGSAAKYNRRIGGDDLADPTGRPSEATKTRGTKTWRRTKTRNSFFTNTADVGKKANGDHQKKATGTTAWRRTKTKSKHGATQTSVPGDKKHQDKSGDGGDEKGKNGDVYKWPGIKGTKTGTGTWKHTKTATAPTETKKGHGGHKDDSWSPEGGAAWGDTFDNGGAADEESWDESGDVRDYDGGKRKSATKTHTTGKKSYATPTDTSDADDDEWYSGGDDSGEEWGGSDGEEWIPGQKWGGAKWGGTAGYGLDDEDDYDRAYPLRRSAAADISPLLNAVLAVILHRNPLLVNATPVAPYALLLPIPEMIAATTALLPTVTGDNAKALDDVAGAVEDWLMTEFAITDGKGWYADGLKIAQGDVGCWFANYTDNT
ncbi:hypothetical protein HK101_003750, partial [Irineochytrium annulatum]